MTLPPLIVAFLFLACAATPANAAKPRYTLMSGKGWTVCETYLKFLNNTPPNEEPPLCDLKLKRVPGMREPDWEELDIIKYLNTVHQIELLLGVGYIEPAPDPDFERWKIQWEARTRANNEHPRLRRTHMTMAPGGAVETVLTYDSDVQRCEKQVRKARRGLPFSSELGNANFFIYDEAKQKVAGSSYWTAMARGVLTLFQGKPCFLNPVAGWDGTRASGLVVISRLEAVPPNPGGMRMHDLPNDPLYNSHELCRLRYAYPFPLSASNKSARR